MDLQSGTHAENGVSHENENGDVNGHDDLKGTIDVTVPSDDVVPVSGDVTAPAVGTDTAAQLKKKKKKPEVTSRIDTGIRGRPRPAAKGATVEPKTTTTTTKTAGAIKKTSTKPTSVT